MRGVIVVIASLGCGLVGWIALGILAENIRRNPDAAEDMSSTALTLIRHSWWAPMVATIVLSLGIIMIASPRYRAMTWTLFAMSMIGILIIFGGVLYAFLGFIGPMYEYRPL
jgi:hypothetical protein